MCKLNCSHSALYNQMYGAHSDTGMAGLYDEAKVGMQKASGTATWLNPKNVRCRTGKEKQIHLEAVRCADMGPLAFRRSDFIDVGMFNVSWSKPGKPGSVAVDCLIQAELWMRGRATVAIALDHPWEDPPDMKVHAVWNQAKHMSVLHNERMKEYHRVWEDGGTKSCTILEKAHKMNKNFDCSTWEPLKCMQTWCKAEPPPLMDCYVKTNHVACPEKMLKLICAEPGHFVHRAKQRLVR